MKRNRLYAYRSWTGYCIYIVDLQDLNNITVTVNRDKKQYTEIDNEKDKEKLNKLLDFLTRKLFK